MRTVIENLIASLDDIETEVDAFLRGYSNIWKWNQDGGGVVVISSRPYAWEDLDVEGRQTQSRLMKNWDHWSHLLRAVLRGSPKETLENVEIATDLIRECLDQSEATYFETVGEARRGVQEQIHALRHALEPLQVGGTNHPPILAVDTNALLFTPDLENWQFDDISEFELVLLPSVLAELDRLKIEHRNEGVRGKAEALIGRIKGYRARGVLTGGVPLRKGRSTIRAVAVEVGLEMPLPWLDRANSDDRILGSAVELMREHPNRGIALVTRDINLQNKAEFARVPFLEPPRLTQ